MLALLILLELTGRLSLVAALLAVPRSSHAAAAIAGGAALAALARSLVKGNVVARETERAWREVAGGVQRTDLATLQARRDDAHHVSMLIDSVREVTTYRATAIAELVSDVIALAAVTVYALVKLPVYWAAVMAGGLVVGGLWVRASRRAQHRAQRDAFAAFGLVARDAEALVEAGLELRAHAAEARHAERLLGAVGRMAAAERRSYRWTAASAALPTALALGLVLTPGELIQELARSVGWLDLGVVGATGLGLSVAVVRGVDAIARSSVHRALFARVAQGGRPHVVAAADGPAIESVSFDGLSVTRGEGTRATPDGLSAQLATCGGLALQGENGVGKTSALLALLGFVEPTSGCIRANGAAVVGDHFQWLRGRAAFLPQRSYVAPSESLAFHGQLGGVDDLEALAEACARVGLEGVLSSGGFDRPMGSLSGGERQRFFLARALARRADLLILDEPEASLDASHRDQLREILAQEATARLVLLVAHDESVIPDAYTRIQCVASGARKLA